MFYKKLVVFDLSENKTNRAKNNSINIISFKSKINKYYIIKKK